MPAQVEKKHQLAEYDSEEIARLNDDDVESSGDWESSDDVRVNHHTSGVRVPDNVGHRESRGRIGRMFVGFGDEDDSTVREEAESMHTPEPKKAVPFIDLTLDDSSSEDEPKPKKRRALHSASESHSSQLVEVQ